VPNQLSNSYVEEKKSSEKDDKEQKMGLRKPIRHGESELPILNRLFSNNSPPKKYIPALY